jgi:hypothetical protein
MIAIKIAVKNKNLSLLTLIKDELKYLPRRHGGKAKKTAHGLNRGLLTKFSFRASVAKNS